MNLNENDLNNFYQLTYYIDTNNLTDFRNEIENNFKDFNYLHVCLFSYCCEKDKDFFIEILIKLLDKDNYFLQNSMLEVCKNNAINVAKLLLKNQLVDPASDLNAPIAILAEKGFYELFCILLNDNRVDAFDDDFWTLRSALSGYFYALECKNDTYGYFKIISLLIEQKNNDMSIDALASFCTEKELSLLKKMFISNKIDNF